MGGEDLSTLLESDDTDARRTQASAVALLFYHRDGTLLVTLEAGRSLVVGRESPADLALFDRSLSRRHARFENVDGTVFVEDLGSTNGTRVNGARVARRPISPGDEVRLGSVSVGIHARSQGIAGLESHDRFRTRIEEEVSRARHFGRSFAVVLLHSTRQAHASRWVPPMATELRPVDRAALYGPHTVEVLLPEATRDAAEAMARRIVSRSPEAGLLAGVAVFPESAASAEELIDAARRASINGEREDAATQTASVEPIAASPTMRQLFEMVHRVAHAVLPVLVTGETGSGKEVVARVLHEKSPRCGGPFVSINCGAIPAHLVESTLFGYERGAFTGAEATTKGLFETAHRGTLLLDEVGELPAAAQAALLRVLETKKVQRVGSTRESDADVRVVAATHRDLEAMSADGTFRTDLYYRLNAMTLAVPPLRQRREDIPALVESFLVRANRANGRRIDSIETAALDRLVAYEWPGNVRELRNAIERAVVIAVDDTLTLDDLPERIRMKNDHGAPARARPTPPRTTALRDQMLEIEADLIREALRATAWNRAEAAERLSLPLRTLNHKIQTLGVTREG